MSITRLVPDVDDLLKMTPSQLGGVMLESMRTQQPRWDARQLKLGIDFGDPTLKDYPQDKRNEAAQVLAEGWSWLVTHGARPASDPVPARVVRLVTASAKDAKPYGCRGIRPRWRTGPRPHPPDDSERLRSPVLFWRLSGSRQPCLR